MSREVRRVPASWEHPRDERGHHVPLLCGSFAQEARQYEEDARQWALGNRRNWGDGPDFVPRDAKTEGMPFEKWHGPPPREEAYMPDWPEAERTHLQMYETTTEGTPISPVMATAEELARWLVDNGASAFADQTVSYEDWLDTIVGDGSAPSFVIAQDGVVVSGVEAMHKMKELGTR